jgi:hypothetical protein
VFKLCSFQHGNCKKEAKLVGEGKVDVGEREGLLFGKFAGVGAKGTKLKETLERRWPP